MKATWGEVHPHLPRALSVAPGPLQLPQGGEVGRREANGMGSGGTQEIAPQEPQGDWGFHPHLCSNWLAGRRMLCAVGESEARWLQSQEDRPIRGVASDI